MLVLTRYVGEAIRVNEGPNATRIVVLSVRGDQVRLGFEAEPDVKIVRTELLDRPNIDDRENGIYRQYGPNGDRP